MTTLARHNALNKRSLIGPSYATKLTGGAGSLAVPAFTSNVRDTMCAFRFPASPLAPTPGPGYDGMPPVYGCELQELLTYHGDKPAVPPKLDVVGTTVSPLKQTVALAHNVGWHGVATSTASLSNGSFSFVFDESPVGIICGIREGSDVPFSPSDPHSVQWGYYIHADTMSIIEDGVIVYTIPAVFNALGVRLGIEFINDRPVYWLALSGDETPRYNMWSSLKRREARRRPLYVRAYLFASTDCVHTPIITPYTNASSAIDGPAFTPLGLSELSALYAYGYKNVVNYMQPLQPLQCNGGKLAGLSGSARLVMQALVSTGTPPALPAPAVEEGNVELSPLLSVGFGRTNAKGTGAVETLPLTVAGGRAGYASGLGYLPALAGSGGGFALADTVGLAGLSAGGTLLTGVVRNVTAGSAPTAGTPMGLGLFIIVSIDSSATLATSGVPGRLLEAEAISLVITDPTMTSTAILLANLFSIIGATTIDSQAQAAGEVWVINVETGAAVRYENFNFNSYARIGGVYYGVRSDGIYELDGDTDAGTQIDATVDMGRMDFGSKMLKRLESAYMAVGSYGTMYLRVTDDTGEVYTYAARRSDTAMQQQRVDVGRGLKANYMQFEIINEAGADFELAGLELMSVDLSRRIK